jgi:hypothetical protein
MPVDLGDTVRIAATCRDVTGAAMDAASVALTVTLPDGTSVMPAVTNPPAAVGEYSADYVPTMAGLYRWRLVATDPAWAETGSFDVGELVPSGIVSLAAMKKHLGKSDEDTGEDDEIREFIEAATGVIEEHRGEAVIRRTVVEEMNLRHPVMVVQLGTSPVQSVTSVTTVDGAITWDVADLHVSPHGVVSVQSGAALSGLVRFVVVAGYTVIPANYTLAAKIIVAHLWETQQQPGLGPNPFAGDAQFLTPTGRGFAIPNRAVELLGRRPPLVA